MEFKAATMASLGQRRDGVRGSDHGVGGAWRPEGHRTFVDIPYKNLFDMKSLEISNFFVDSNRPTALSRQRISNKHGGFSMCAWSVIHRRKTGRFQHGNLECNQCTTHGYNQFTRGRSYSVMLKCYSVMLKSSCRKGAMHLQLLFLELYTDSPHTEEIKNKKVSKIEQEVCPSIAELGPTVSHPKKGSNSSVFVSDCNTVQAPHRARSYFTEPIFTKQVARAVLEV
jgi:hypothetical protein